MADDIRHRTSHRWLEVTTVIGCRVACSYCPQRALTSSYRHRPKKGVVLTLEDFRAYLATVPTHVKIAFSGYSEPFLNPACVELMQYASDRGHILIASSTLEGMTVEQARAVAKIPFEHFHVHLANDKEQERVTIDQRYFDILDIFMGLPSFTFHSDGYKVHRKIARHLETYTLRQVHSRAGNVIEGSDDACDEQERIDAIHMKGPITCDRLQGNVLLPNGDVALCCMDFGLRHVIGNLGDQPYHTLFESDEYRRVLDAMAGDGMDILCRTCHKAVALEPAE